MRRPGVLSAVVRQTQTNKHERAQSSLPSAKTIRNAALGLGAVGTVAALTTAYAVTRAASRKASRNRPDISMYRAVTPSGDPFDKSRYATLTKPQNQALLDLVTDTNFKSFPAGSSVGVRLDAGTMRASADGTTGEVRIEWIEDAKITRVVRPVPGKIILCALGNFMILDSALAVNSISGTVERAGYSKGQPALPVCAAMARAFAERKSESLKVEALSDEKGNWLPQAATCRWREGPERTVVECTVDSHVMTVVQYINVDRVLQPTKSADNDPHQQSEAVAETGLPSTCSKNDTCTIPNASNYRVITPHTSQWSLSQYKTLTLTQEVLMREILTASVSTATNGKESIIKRNSGDFVWNDGAVSKIIRAPVEGEIILCASDTCTVSPVIPDAAQRLASLKAILAIHSLSNAQTMDDFSVQHATMAMAMMNSPEFDVTKRHEVQALTNDRGEWDFALLGVWPDAHSANSATLSYRRRDGNDYVDHHSWNVTQSAAFGHDPYARHSARPVAIYTE